LEAEIRRGATWRDLHEEQKQRLHRAEEEIQSVCAKIEEVKAKTMEERKATELAEEELVEKRRVLGRSNADTEAEMTYLDEKSAELQRKQDGLENEAKDLQQQLRTTIYHVGKKEREKELKEAELVEARQNIHMMQDEMDQVNLQLQAQCDRVQNVDSSLRLSRDLGSKVNSMREMLKEGHSALSQLCSHVERERSQREQCVQGLRQQQMRTELLLQLLHHFKTRTQDLAPQVLLSQAAELVQEQMAPDSTEYHGATEPPNAGHSAVPPRNSSRGRR
jgi:chromosome segregation ATPase